MGIEPSHKNAESTQNQLRPTDARVGCTQIRAQIPGELGPGLATGVAAWAKLSPPLKAAIVAIVNSVEGALGALRTTPYAVVALSAGSLSGTLPASQLTGTLVGDGSGLTSANALQLGGYDASA